MTIGPVSHQLSCSPLNTNCDGDIDLKYISCCSQIPSNMTEISFTRSFLSALDSRPIKLSSDHTSDPRKFPSGAVVRFALFQHDYPLHIYAWDELTKPTL